MSNNIAYTCISHNDSISTINEQHARAAELFARLFATMIRGIVPCVGFCDVHKATRREDLSSLEEPFVRRTRLARTTARRPGTRYDLNDERNDATMGYARWVHQEAAANNSGWEHFRPAVACAWCTGVINSGIASLIRDKTRRRGNYHGDVALRSVTNSRVCTNEPRARTHAINT